MKQHDDFKSHPAPLFSDFHLNRPSILRNCTLYCIPLHSVRKCCQLLRSTVFHCVASIANITSRCKILSLIAFHCFSLQALALSDPFDKKEPASINEPWMFSHFRETQLNAKVSIPPSAIAWIPNQWNGGIPFDCFSSSSAVEHWLPLQSIVFHCKCRQS